MTSMHETAGGAPESDVVGELMSTRSTRASVIGLGAALIILAGIALIAYLSLQALVERMSWVSHTQEVLRETEVVISQLKDVETSVRGFLIGGEREFLVPYREALDSIPLHLARLKELTSDNPEQQGRVTALEKLTRKRLAEAAEFLATGEKAAGIIVSQTAREKILTGKQTMDQIRAVADDLRVHEENLLTLRSAESRRGSRLSAAVIILGTLTSFALLIAAFVFLRNEIRQRTSAERAANDHALEVENLYNHAPCGYHSVDRNGVFVRMNDTELAWLGYQREEIIGKLKFVDIVAPEYKQTVLDNFPRLVDGGITANLEYRLLRKDGTTFPVSVNAVPMLDADGNFVMSRTTMFDITAIKEVENQTRMANAFLDAVVENIPSMIFVKDAQSLRFVRINKAEEEFLGIPREKLVGKTDYDLFPASQSDFFTAKDREVLQATGLHVFEEELTTDAGTRHLRTRKIGLRDDAGKPEYLLGISEDITEQKLAEQAIRELNVDLQMRANQLEAANKELESFSYSVSHDLRAPLRAIDGFSRIFQEDYGASVDDEGRRLLAVIRDNSQRMGVLIDDLLAFSRLGRQSLSTEPLEMTELVQAAVEEIRSGGAYSAAEILLHPLPGVRADPILLRQVWINLLSNALKYSSTRTSPRIEIGCVAASGSEGYLTYFVKDNGVGFDMRYYDKLFGVFQRLHGIDEFTGTGVGLAIVHRLVTRHGGRVWAEAELDKGATFFLSLPVGGST